MFVRTLDDVAAAGRFVSLGEEEARSARIVTTDDGVGFSYNDNLSKRAVDVVLWYKNHWEANYIISGEGEVTDLTTNQAWPLRPGALYVVGPNDRHHLKFDQGTHLLSVFCPPLRGHENRNEHGGYEASGPVPQTDRRMFVKYEDEMLAAGQGQLLANSRSTSVRMLVKADDLGFGFSSVKAPAGGENILWYKNHWEANHIISGVGEITELATGKTWKLEPGVSYTVGPEDRHRVRWETGSDIHVISIFCPPLVGTERHDAEGTLAASGPVPPGPPVG